MWSLVLCHFIRNLLVALSREEAQLSWLLSGIPPMKTVHARAQVSQSTSPIDGHLCLLCCVSASCTLHPFDEDQVILNVLKEWLAEFSCSPVLSRGIVGDLSSFVAAIFNRLTGFCSDWNEWDE